MNRTKQKQETPTELFCREMTEAFDYFNRELFGGELPPVLITLQRRRGARGYYAANRFKGRDDGSMTDEIAMNPKHFERSDKETLSTLVHEMVHLWQHKFGKPSRGNYHNRQFAEKMDEVGLICSKTGEPGGAKTGRGMTHYIVPSGRFDIAFQRVNLAITWRDAFTDKKKPVGKKRNKTKFECKGCGANAWGKESLVILCGPCDQRMFPEGYKPQESKWKGWGTSSFRSGPVTRAEATS